MSVDPKAASLRDLDLSRIKYLTYDSDHPTAQAFAALDPAIRNTMLAHGIVPTINALLSHISAVADAMPRCRPGIGAVLKQLVVMIENPELFEQFRATNRGPQQ